MQQKIYISSLAAKVLDLNTSTLRKYATLLENFNYPIKRNDRGQRMYSEQDIKKIIEFKNLIDKGWSLVKAAECVTIEYQTEGIEETVEKLILRVAEIEKLLKKRQ